MSTLVIEIPMRPRLHPSSPAEAAPPTSDASTEYTYALSPDGVALLRQGSATAKLLPKATTVVAVLCDADVSWHRLPLPKAPASKLASALGAMLEDALLVEADAVHLAVAPQPVPGAPTWVAAVDRRWLRAELAALEKAQVFVDRVAPMAWPDDPPTGHFAEIPQSAGDGAAHGIALTWAHADGVATLRLQGGLTRALVPNPPPEGTRWSASPGAASGAEQWLGSPVAVMPQGQRLLQASRSLWNLRQFDLAQRTRGTRALRDSVRRFMSPAWRPVRWGLGALVVAQLVGLNVWAWHQKSTIAQRELALRNVVKQSFPRASELDIQRDAAAVMARETQTLRAAAGKPGETDFETLMQAAASAWPDGRAPAENLRFEPGKLTLSAAGWSPDQIERFRSLLRPAGWQVESAEGRLTLSRAPAGAAS